MASAVLRESDAFEERKEKRYWTYDELLAEMGESNEPMELWDGELIMSPTPTPKHQTIVLSFASRLREFVNEKKLGRVFVSPLDVILTQTRVVQPDVLFISNANMAILQDRIRGAPDLCMETVSRTWRRDRIEKRELYSEFGVKEYWIIDPERASIEVLELVKGTFQTYARTSDAQTARSKLLDGFGVSFNELLV
ncbi:MAG TPA: Uma2 family endonuclease [Verrucomicrobiae bacterium]|nr:Uma2 family endonuclease [Verrucomicrobiae bacterium]